MTFLGGTCLAGQPLDKSGQPLATWQPLDSYWAATVLDSWAATGQVWTAIEQGSEQLPLHILVQTNMDPIQNRNKQKCSSVLRKRVWV
jgi:hypothetical protein